MGTLAITVGLTGVTPAFAASQQVTTGKIESPVVSTQAKVQPNNVIIDIAKKAFIYALRHGGSALGKYLSKVSPKAGAAIKKYALKLAEVLESIEKIQEYPIAIGLIKLGVPPSDAWLIAQAVVFLFGL